MTDDKGSSDDPAARSPLTPASAGLTPGSARSLRHRRSPENGGSAGPDVSAVAAPVSPSESSFAEIRFKGARKDYFSYAGLDLSEKALVVVEAERGFDVGRVTALGAVAERKCSSSGGCATPTPEQRVLRLANDQEKASIPELRAEEEVVCRRARKMAVERDLDMKIFDAEWRFDRRKLFLYFTAPRRVDFRSFLPELGRAFKTRVRLEHLGVREEAKQIGGVGRCGRELCCSTWLPSLRRVTMSVARDQGLALNPDAISGCCGRLMCCLLYEHSSYVEARRRFPRRGRVLAIEGGRATVVKTDIFREIVWLEDERGERRQVGLGDLEELMRLAAASSAKVERTGPSGLIRPHGRDDRRRGRRR